MTLTNHPWHDIPIGKEIPDRVNAVIEIPKNTKSKYELDKKTGYLKLDRLLNSSVQYPTNYGFIPQTLGEDNDPLDIVVISQLEIIPLCIVSARIIGVMRMLDGNDPDDKIISVADNDGSFNHINDINELPASLTSELKTFFEDYKKLEHKTVKVKELQNAQIAKDIIRQSRKKYQRTFSLTNAH